MPVKKIPKVAVVGHTGGYGLGGVDNGAAAYGNQTVDMCGASATYAFHNEGVDRIGSHASKFYKINSYGAQRILHAVDKTAFARIVLAEYHHNFCGTGEKSEHADFFFGTAAKLKKRGRIEAEIFHNEVN